MTSHAFRKAQTAFALLQASGVEIVAFNGGWLVRGQDCYSEEFDLVRSMVATLGDWESQGERFYPITSLHKDDLRDVFRDPKTRRLPARVGQRIDALTDGQMEYLAKKMADVFCNCCYWEALRAMFLDYFWPAEGEGKQSEADSQESEAGGAP